MKRSNLRMCMMMAFVILQISIFSATAQDIKLQFNSNKQFKIAQFTDLHYFLGEEKSPEVLENIESVMEAEIPDLVILTGDIVTFKRPRKQIMDSWESITDKLIEYKTPYAIVFGNHDDEADVTREELLTYLSNRPYCIISDDEECGLKGVGNYTLPIYNRKGIAEKLIYCIDSRSYSLAKDKGVDGYGWIDRSQIDWFAQTNKSWLAKNKDIQSLLFFHIPLPEYKHAFFHGEYKNGVRMEEECAPKINTGMFSEMILQGNVLGTFVGHDHNNNYLAQLYNIALCYGYFSGGNTYGDLPLNGARLILLEENKRRFKTWLRRIDGKVLYETEIPYLKKKNKK